MPINLCKEYVEDGYTSKLQRVNSKYNFFLGWSNFMQILRGAFTAAPWGICSQRVTVYTFSHKNPKLRIFLAASFSGEIAGAVCYLWFIAIHLDFDGSCATIPCPTDLHCISVRFWIFEWSWHDRVSYMFRLASSSLTKRWYSLFSSGGAKFLLPVLQDSVLTYLVFSGQFCPYLT